MSIAEFIGRRVSPMPINEISAEDAESEVTSKRSSDLVDELYDFGREMVREVLSRTAHLDAKATTLLGWAFGAVAFILLGLDWQKATDRLELLGGIAALCATLASIQAAMALRVSRWQIPSEADWFKFELFSSPDRLRIYHLVSMLEMHQHHNRQNMVKGEQILRSQWLLVGATVLLGIVVVLR
jgi:hypothetical protein